MGNRVEQERCCRRGKDGPTERERVVEEVVRATKTQHIYRAQQKEVRNRLLQSM
jgi:hypothetical protein